MYNSFIVSLFPIMQLLLKNLKFNSLVGQIVMQYDRIMKANLS